MNTVHWQPNIRTDAQGNAIVNFIMAILQERS